MEHRCKSIYNGNFSQNLFKRPLKLRRRNARPNVGGRGGWQRQAIVV